MKFCAVAAAAVVVVLPLVSAECRELSNSGSATRPEVHRNRPTAAQLLSFLLSHVQPKGALATVNAILSMPATATAVTPVLIAANAPALRRSPLSILPGVI
jgi:hypothetical protein